MARTICGVCTLTFETEEEYRLHCEFMDNATRRARRRLWFADRSVDLAVEEDLPDD